MAIPQTQELMLPILELHASGIEYLKQELINDVAQHLNRPEWVDMSTGNPNQALFHKRVTRAQDYLIHAHMLMTTAEGTIIGPRGAEIVANPPAKLNLHYLAQYPEFTQFLTTSEATEDPELREIIRFLNMTADYGPVNANSDMSTVVVMAESSTPAPAVAERSTSLPTDSIISAPPPVATPPPPPSIAPQPSPQATPSLNSQELLMALAALQQMNNQQANGNGATKSVVDDDHGPEYKRVVSDKTNAAAFQKQPVNITLLALFRILESYFQHPWLYLSPILVMTIACFTYFALEEPNYVSEGVISIQSDTLLENVAGIGDSGFNWVTPAQATSDEFNELMQTDAFVRLIVQQTPLEGRMDDGEDAIEETIQDTRDALIILPLGANQVRLTADYRVPEIAHKIAEGAVNAFIQWKIDSDKQDSISARVFLENLIPEYEAEYNEAIANLESFLLQNPEPLRGNRPALEQLQIERLETEVGQSYNRLITAEENLEEIRLQEVIAEGTTKQTYTIVDYPLEPATPEIYLEDVVTIVAIFASVGITLTVLGIIGNSLLDRTMRLPIDARYVTDLPVLAVIDNLSDKDAKKGLKGLIDRLIREVSSKLSKDKGEDKEKEKPNAKSTKSKKKQEAAS